MLGNILEINDSIVLVKLAIDINQQNNLINLHVVFESDKKIVGEIINLSQTIMKVNIVGEIVNNQFIPGVTSKPAFKSKIRIIKLDELELIFGKQTPVLGETYFGKSSVYENYNINVKINDFFNNHYAILGNSGSGKSSTVASLLQKLFTGTNTPPVNSNFFFFDAYGEYTRAFSHFSKVNPNLNYKTYTTNTKFPDTDVIQIPLWLLDVDDLALLLDANNPAQLPILEKTLKLVKILSGDSQEVIKFKNDIIARALLDILLSGRESTKIRDQVTAILTKFNTSQLSLETEIVQPGYTRTFKQCIFIDKTGKIQEMELVVDFIKKYIIEEAEELNENDLYNYYGLKDLENALEFALVSEGILKSDKVFDYANVLIVRLHSLVTSDYSKFFEYDKYVTKEQYITSLLTTNFNTKAQIVNFNINYVDDRLANVITKILSKMLFDINANLQERGSRAYHLIIEEAHRYVKNDLDSELLGYNIFERITKEGRKYGIFLGVITQRPSELSDTVLSQCANFLILKMLHPKDIEYVKNMVPNITNEVIEQVKNLKPGYCIAFGHAFKVPTFLKIDIPNPLPHSMNVDLKNVWYQNVNKDLN